MGSFCVSHSHIVYPSREFTSKWLHLFLVFLQISQRQMALVTLFNQIISCYSNSFKAITITYLLTYYWWMVSENLKRWVLKIDYMWAECIIESNFLPWGQIRRDCCLNHWQWRGKIFARGKRNNYDWIKSTSDSVWEENSVIRLQWVLDSFLLNFLAPLVIDFLLPLLLLCLPCA